MCNLRDLKLILNMKEYNIICIININIDVAICILHVRSTFDLNQHKSVIIVNRLQKIIYVISIYYLNFL